MIRACLFDMGNVLVHFSHTRMLEQMATVCHCEPQLLKEWLFDSGRLLDYERGSISDDELHSQIEQLLGRKIDPEELRLAASDIFSVNEPIVPLLEELRKKEIPLILLSNTSRIHFEHIRQQFSILDYFDRFVLSYQVGMIKPEPGIFEIAAQKAQTAPEHCFFTDDIPENIIAARQAGLQAEQFHNAAQLSQFLGEKLSLDAFTR